MSKYQVGHKFKDKEATIEILYVLPKFNMNNNQMYLIRDDRSDEVLFYTMSEEFMTQFYEHIII